MTCAFIGGWEPDCTEEALENKRFCAFHRDYETKHCNHCGAPAVTYCIETVMGGALVCGEPLCEAHQHTCKRHS